MDRILIIDDHVELTEFLTECLASEGLSVDSAQNGEEGLNKALSQEYALVILDIMLPGIDGFEVLRRLKADEALRDIPVIFLSALNDMQDKLFALNAGGQDYITKPFQAEEVLARVDTHLRLRHLQHELAEHNRRLQERVAEQVKDISDSQIATIIALARLSESRDDDTGKHIERVQVFCRLLAESLANLPRFAAVIVRDFIENIVLASPLHDVGKVGISDSILLKPGKLTREEFEVMKNHTVIGSRTLAAVKNRYPKNALITMGISIAHHHHEWWDGSGYPDELKGEEIPVEARIMAVADAYDALRSKRVYKDAYSHDRSCGILMEGKGTQFDPDMVDAFMGVETRFDQLRTEMRD